MALSSCGNLYVGDFVEFRHPSLGNTSGKVEKFFMRVLNCVFSLLLIGFFSLFQEGSVDVHMQVEMLLNVSQIWIECPNVSTLHTGMDSFLRYKQIEIVVCSVSAVIPPPSCVLILDSSTNSLLQLQIQVRYVS